MRRLSSLTLGCCVIGLICSAASIALGQTPKEAVSRAIEEAKRANPRLTVNVDPLSGLPRSIKGLGSGASLTASPGTAPQRELTDTEVRKAVQDFFDRRSATRGLGASLFPAGHKDAREEVTRVRRDPDVPGNWVATVEQKVGNIRVFGSSAKAVVGPSAAVIDLSASMSAVDVTTIAPAVTQNDAVTVARQKLGQLIQQFPEGLGRGLPWPRTTNAVAATELVVFDPILTVPTDSIAADLAGRNARLAWTVTIDQIRFFVDAQDKRVLYYYRDQPSARVRRVFDLNGDTRLKGKPVIDEAGNIKAASIADDAGQAFENAGRVYDFFFNSFKRDSFDDNGRTNSPGGGAIESFVRYGTMRNALWCTKVATGCPKSNVIVYGSGYAGALDIVGHEFTHGVVAAEADLTYNGQSGAVNESIADIFGVLIKHASGNGNWLIGERLPQRSIDRPLRNMSNPTMGRFNRAKGYDEATNNGQPDHFANVLTERDAICSSLEFADSGCVHLNSGILNKLAFLIAEGGKHGGVTVQGIGREKLGRITYRTLTLKLNRSSGLVATANGMLESCNDLATAGVAGINQANCSALQGAVNSVGLASGS